MQLSALTVFLAIASLVPSSLAVTVSSAAQVKGSLTYDYIIVGGMSIICLEYEERV